jgi:hypothetical protein
MSRVEEFFGANRANIAGAAGDENVHALIMGKFCVVKSSK